jgi:hypothetical protein
MSGAASSPIDGTNVYNYLNNNLSRLPVRERISVRLATCLFALNLDLSLPLSEVLSDYSPTSVLISARKVSCCSAAQASSRGNK